MRRNPSRRSRSRSSPVLLTPRPSFSELRQARRHVAETGQGRFQVFDDLLGQDVRCREIVEVVETFVLEPKDVQARLVAGDQLLIRVALEAIRGLAVVTVLGVVTGNEVVQVFPLEGL